jgi:hypothetical protein
VRVSDKASDAGVQLAQRRLHDDRGFQFDHQTIAPPKPPEWMRWLSEKLAWLGPYLKYVFWAGLVVLSLLILYAIAREVLRLRKPTARPEGPRLVADPPWRPDANDARDLLSAADRLAAEGRFLEAAHLLLLRSVEDIQKHRPKALRVSLTSREIAVLPALPEVARPAFASIARVVERGLFGGRPVDGDDFAACRSAYEAFALPDGWRG